jgi:hypothetical protein
VSELFDFLIIFETAVSEMGGLIDWAMSKLVQANTLAK